MAERRPHPLLVASLFLAAILSLFSIYRRFQAETQNRALALATEIDTAESLGAAAGLSPAEALAKLKRDGLNAVVLGDESVGELAGERLLVVRREGAQTLLTDVAPTVVERVRRGLTLRGFRFSERDGTFEVPASSGFVRQTSVGLDPEAAQEARKAGMQIVARAGNPAGVSGKYVRGTLAWMHELGATMFLPSGDQVLGRRDALPATQEALAATGMRYLTPEFAKLGGDQNMIEAVPENVIRLHSAQSAELDRLTALDAVDRYEKAARERQMRVLLLRPLTNAAEDPLAAFGGFVKDIRKAVEGDGLEIGTPHPSVAPNLPRFLSVLIGICAAPFVWFAAAAFVTDRRARTAGAILLGLLAVGCVSKTGAQLMALLAAASAPVAAFVLLDEVALRLKGPEWARILQSFLLVSAVSLVGGLVVAGMLNGLPYYVKADEFKGIKVAVFLPVLGIGWYAFTKLTDWRGNLRSPITWGAVILATFLAGAMAFMLARTGNDSGVGASGPEMLLRSALDRYAYVRPRTKEFLVGHPLLIVALGLYLRQRRAAVPNPVRGGWIALGLLLGAVGQTSVVNTLCHLHIPVALSLARIGIGLFLGAIFGFVLWAFVGRLERAPAGGETSVGEAD